jgi:hypothetical protein
VACGSYGQDVPGAAGRFPLLCCAALTAGELARAGKVRGNRKLRVAFAQPYGRGISQPRPVLWGACYRQGCSSALSLCESIGQHALLVLMTCSGSQR